MPEPTPGLACEADGYYAVPPGKVATVVTYLEMTAPPADSEPEARPDLSLRRVENPEPAWFRDLYQRIGYEWMWFSRLSHDDAALSALIRDPAVEIHALVREGRDEGLVELNRRDPANVELAFFGLTPAVLGQGAGRWLMPRVIELAFQEGPSGARPARLWLHTCTLDHPKALGFYRRAGFRPFKRAVEIASDPRLQGLLPRDSGRHIPIIE